MEHYVPISIAINKKVWNIADNGMVFSETGVEGKLHDFVASLPKEEVIIVTFENGDRIRVPAYTFRPGGTNIARPD